MTVSISHGLSDRLAAARKRARLTAEELAALAGQGLTRSVIANLESGRKEDLLVQQLIAVAFVLGVSPADLVFDVKQPYGRVHLTDGTLKANAKRWVVAEWFGGHRTARELVAKTELVAKFEGPGYSPPSEAATENDLIRYGLRRRSELMAQLAKVEQGAQPDAETARSIRDELFTLERGLRSFDVSLGNTIHPEDLF